MPSREHFVLLKHFNNALKHFNNAQIKISSTSQHTVSLTCTGTDKQLMLKHCSKSDKITKINC